MSLPSHTQTHAHTHTHTCTYIHTYIPNNWHWSDCADAQHDLCLSYSNMQFVGSLTARPIKNNYVFKLQQLSAQIISKYNNNNNDNYTNNKNKIHTHTCTYIHTYIPNNWHWSNCADAQHDLCLSYSNMQFVGSLTARPIKNNYVFKLQQLSAQIISKYNNNNNDNYTNNKNKIHTHTCTYIHTYIPNNWHWSNCADAQHDLCLSYSNMQFVGSLTARPIKNNYVFKLQQLSAQIISKYNNNNNNNYTNNKNKIYA